jgi:excisionase family DNA binding protein
VTAPDIAAMPAVLTVQEAALVLRISAWSLYSAIRRGEIAHVRLGRCVRVPRRAVLDLLGEPASPPPG